MSRTLPPDVHSALERETGARVTTVRGVGGGCISPAARVELEDGAAVFVKTAPAGAPDDLFRQEAHSLERLRRAEVVRVPGVVAVATAWIALEWLEPVAGSAASWHELGRALARLHAAPAADWGWEADNYIGPLPQSNAPAESWPAFWRERRLRPQLERAAGAFDAATLRSFDRLMDELEERLGPADEEGASLLHGDLWSGNVHMTAEGPALVDPASYRGHGEVDLAMAALFGGFPAGFEQAYTAERPLAEGADRRRAIYQLYYLLVHVNLFGAGYVAGTCRSLAAALG